MRYFVVSLFVVLFSFASAPVHAQRALNPGPLDVSGKLIQNELGPCVVQDIGSFSEFPLVVQGRTPALDALLKKNMTPAREFGDMYLDVPTANLKGVVEIVNGRYLYIVDAVALPDQAAADALSALESVAAAAQALEDGRKHVHAAAIANAAVPLANELVKSTAGTELASRAREVLRKLQGFAQ